MNSRLSWSDLGRRVLRITSSSATPQPFHIVHQELEIMTGLLGSKQWIIKRVDVRGLWQSLNMR